MKEQSQRSSNRHKKELSVAKERFDSCLKTSQSLQSYITHLYAKLDTSSSDRSNAGTKTHNVTWTSSSDHKCGDKCQSSMDDLEIATHHHHHHHRHHHQEHSHRHSLQSNTSSTKSSSSSQQQQPNPFTQKTRAATLSSTLSVDSQSSNT